MTLQKKTTKIPMFHDRTTSKWNILNFPFSDPLQYNIQALTVHSYYKLKGFRLKLILQFQK